MNNLRLLNFRSFKDTGVVSIKPLTIFVGANSSGKSSFLRLFPLLKQSINSPKHGPILWYDKDFVDFGDFSTSVRRGENSMVLQFDLDVRKSMYRRSERELVNVSLSLSKEKKTNYDFIYKMGLRYKFVDVECIFSDPSASDVIKAEITINGEKRKNKRVKVGSSTRILPILSYENEDRIDNIELLVKELSHRNPHEAYFDAEDCMFVSADDISEVLAGKLSDIALSKLVNDIAYANLRSLFEQIEISLHRELDLLQYIGPFRAEPERTYRLNNIASDVMDMRGSNMAMFLKEMSESDRDGLNSILDSRYGFKLFCEPLDAGLRVMIERNGVRTDLIDNGFGYSQILPILISTYALRKKVQNNKQNYIFCVEQPELHLHPSMQYKYGQSLADTILKENRKSGFCHQIIVETHSRSLIEAIGRYVADGKVKKEDVAVYLFEQEKETDSKKLAATQVTLSEFDDEGYLTNWPMGFLD